MPPELKGPAHPSRTARLELDPRRDSRSQIPRRPTVEHICCRTGGLILELVPIGSSADMVPRVVSLLDHVRQLMGEREPATRAAQSGVTEDDVVTPCESDCVTGAS